MGVQLKKTHPPQQRWWVVFLLKIMLVFPQDSVSLFSVLHCGSPCRSTVTILEIIVVL